MHEQSAKGRQNKGVNNHGNKLFNPRLRGEGRRKQAKTGKEQEKGESGRQQTQSSINQVRKTGTKTDSLGQKGKVA